MKNLSQAPIGIIITMGKVVIDANGGLKDFIRHFTNCCKDEDSGYWLQKSRAAPTQDIAHVYIVLCNRVWARLYYGGYCPEHDKIVWMLDGSRRLFPWPHMMLAGPIEKAPLKIPMRGFQGFRYVYEPIF
jgi:hypothetical protein